jgi:signal transduction histidine kinase
MQVVPREADTGDEAATYAQRRDGMTDAASEARPPARLTGTQRVWLLSAAIAGAAALVYLLWVRGLEPLDAPLRIPWWALAILFGAAEMSVIHFQFRREAHSFSLGEIPTVIGLFFAAPSDLILAQLVGAVVALVVHRRQSPVKVAFNAAHFVLGTCLAVVIFRAIVGGEDPFGPIGWAGAFAATFGMDLLGAFLVTAAIGMAEGTGLRLPRLPDLVGIGLAISLTNTSLAVVAVTILWAQPWAVWMLVVPAGILVPAYRAYMAGRQRHETLDSLYQATRLLQRSLKVESMMPTLLQRARGMFRAEVAEVTLFPLGDSDKAVVATLGPGNDVDEALRDLDPTVGVWARVASEDQALLLARPIEGERLQTHFGARGIRDAMVAPLHGKAGVVGTFMVANRLGEVSTFDPEDLQVFEALASHASVSLENARLVGRLEDSLARLTEMNRLKDDFVATVSHELRTPLTSIHGCIKTLLAPDADLDPETQRALMDAIDRQADRLVILIEDLLVASRIESNSVRPVIAPMDLAALARQVVEDTRSRAAGHRLRLRVEGEVPTVESDERKVRQILVNLVENAIKYTPEGTDVTVRCRPEAEGVAATVEDQGSGIPPELHQKIFERFYQVDQSSTRTVGGTGLGLYICQRLAEIIGGRVTLDRSDEDGSVFKVWIPRTPPADSLRGTSGRGLPVDLVRR